MTLSLPESFRTLPQTCGYVGLKSLCAVRSLPDVATWSCMTQKQNVHKSCGKDGDKVDENSTALRGAFCYIRKNRSFTLLPPPPPQLMRWLLRTAALAAESYERKVSMSGRPAGRPRWRSLDAYTGASPRIFEWGDESSAVWPATPKIPLI